MPTISKPFAVSDIVSKASLLNRRDKKQVAKNRINWQVFPPFLLVVGLAIVATAIIGGQIYSDIFLGQVRQDLESSATLLQDRFKPLLTANNKKAIDVLCKSVIEESKIRVTIIDRSGAVLGDSERSPHTMKNQLESEEFQQAFNGQVGASERFNNVVKRNLMFVAIPIRTAADDQVTHALRTSISTQAIYHGKRSFYLYLIVPILVFTLLAAFLSKRLSKRIALPLLEMVNTANRFANGEKNAAKAEFDSFEEMRTLFHSINSMGQQLNKRIADCGQQRKELEAILASMSEGIIAVDSSSLVQSLNKAARELLNITATKYSGRPLIEVGRNHDLMTLVDHTLETGTRQQAKFVVSSNEERSLSASVSPIINSKGEVAGAAIVISDVTKQSKLETMRKDFVANVSHELKTPITSVKGYVETLLDAENLDEKTRIRFLQIVVKQTDRLHNIIEDLLQLSRLDEENSEIPMDPANVSFVIDSAIEACSRLSEEKNSKINIGGQHGVFVIANAALLEQAIINLLDNAIKYSPENSEISIDVNTNESHVDIQVSDNGKGIPEKYHDRIFERFYRIDKARSQSNGSTGLGLAIVKHISLLHRGNVSIKSADGQGSSFTISLPIASPKEKA